MKTAYKPSKATPKPKRAKAGDCARASCSVVSAAISINVEADGDAAGKGVKCWTVRRRKTSKSRTWSPVRLTFNSDLNGMAVFGYLMGKRNEPTWKGWGHLDVLPTTDPRNAELREPEADKKP